MNISKKASFIHNIRLITLISMITMLSDVFLNKGISYVTLYFYTESITEKTKTHYFNISEMVLKAIVGNIQLTESFSGLYLRNLDFLEFFKAKVDALLKKQNATNFTFSSDIDILNDTFIGNPEELVLDPEVFNIFPTELPLFCASNNITLCSELSPYEFKPKKSVLDYYHNISFAVEKNLSLKKKSLKSFSI